MVLFTKISIQFLLQVDIHTGVPLSQFPEKTEEQAKDHKHFKA